MHVGIDPVYSRYTATFKITPPRSTLRTQTTTQPHPLSILLTMQTVKQESFLVVAFLATIAAYAFEHAALAGGQVTALVASGLIIVAILLAALRVAHHAEVLAEKVGEPYGTMILTLAAVLVEVVILAIMTSHTPAPTLMRDTVYSAVMLDINGILGLAAIMGGLKHGEQPYNVDSGNTYIVMILTALGISMVVPEFIPQGKWQAYSIFTIIIMVLMYAMFLRLQTGKHSYFFSYKYGARRPGHEEAEEEDHGNTRASAALLVAGLVLIGALAEVMSKTLDLGLAGTGLPPITVALVVAVISASPEILTALRSALANRMQPVVNIALGASLSTVVLTVPVIEALALFTHHPIEILAQSYGVGTHTAS